MEWHYSLLRVIMGGRACLWTVGCSHGIRKLWTVIVVSRTYSWTIDTPRGNFIGPTKTFELLSFRHPQFLKRGFRSHCCNIIGFNNKHEKQKKSSRMLMHQSVERNQGNQFVDSIHCPDDSTTTTVEWSSSLPVITENGGAIATSTSACDPRPT